MHGGGMIFLHRFFGLEQPLDWEAATGCVLVSVEDRLAPENPQPALTKDCYAGLGLAAAIALMAHDQGGPPSLSSLMLDDRSDSTSSIQYDNDEPVALCQQPIAQGDVPGDRAGRDDISEYFAPAPAKDLEGLSPAWVDVGSAKVMCDKMITYTSKFWAAGV
ncbi:hypothetical protein MMC17_004115 [Xylographa soralifera]|nr:hypothetical protein [Xylographa soralifera]